MQEFLSPTDEEEGSVTNQVELKISAPNHKIISVVIHRNWTTQQVYRTVIDKVSSSGCSRLYHLRSGVYKVEYLNKIKGFGDGEENQKLEKKKKEIF